VGELADVKTGVRTQHAQKIGSGGARVESGFGRIAALPDRNLLPIEVEHEHADRRGKVAAAPPLRINRGDELRQAHTPRPRALLEALPECIFEAHAGAMASEEDGMFDDN
jgi:hypothetical protein